jgi:hypothetical protein
LLRLRVSARGALRERDEPVHGRRRIEKETAPLAKKICKNMSFARLGRGIVAALLAFPGKLPYHFGFVSLASPFAR